MPNRDFNDSVKLGVITENLKKNNGEICCAICGAKLASIQECHFDHIFPFAKGGKSTLENCQILCINCNLKKTDKEMKDFLLEEKAKRFLAGETELEQKQELPAQDVARQSSFDKGSMTKEKFDKTVQSFISERGTIKQADFFREYNHLPSISYVKKYYGDLKTLKEAFGIEDLSASWNRDTIKSALEKHIEQHGNVFERELNKKNKLPSLPCILSHYPEYKTLSEIKRKMFNLSIREKWDYDSVLQAGKDFVKNNGKVTESCLRAENHLPNGRIVYRYFGSIAAYQQAIGSDISAKNDFISVDTIQEAVNQYFGDKERIIESRGAFFKTFPISPATVHKRFGSFASFCQKYGITVQKMKKAKYSKQEVDDAIAKWIKTGKDIPNGKDLNKLGLPSMSVILKYYEDWKEPFVLYRKMFDKLNQ